MYETTKPSLLRSYVSLPSSQVTVWVDRREEQAGVERQLQEVYKGDRFLKGHGFIAQVLLGDWIGLVYARTHSVHVNPDDMATTGVRRLFSALREKIRSDNPHNTALADYELSQTEATTRYWLHPASRRYFDRPSLKFHGTKRELDETVATATFENLAVPLEDKFNPAA